MCFNTSEKQQAGQGSLKDNGIRITHHSINYIECSNQCIFPLVFYSKLSLVFCTELKSVFG